ncbi:MAG: nucleotide pyrophosphohydrolase [Idiomarina sp.]|nr:nucleotide pyrophosphohydrolase [Idiomarina sp.]
MDAKPTLEELQQTLDAFSKARNWKQFHSIKNLSMALSVEVAELLELSQWATEAESNNPSEALLASYKDEAADVFIYLLMLAQKLDIDIIQAAIEKLEKNRKKYPTRET